MNRQDEIEIIMKHLYSEIKKQSDGCHLSMKDQFNDIHRQMELIKANVDDYFKLYNEIYQNR